jgi:hypothetical protein
LERLELTADQLLQLARAGKAVAGLADDVRDRMRTDLHHGDGAAPRPYREDDQCAPTALACPRPESRRASVSSSGAHQRFAVSPRGFVDRHRGYGESCPVSLRPHSEMSSDLWCFRPRRYGWRVTGTAASRGSGRRRSRRGRGCRERPGSSASGVGAATVAAPHKGDPA